MIKWTNTEKYLIAENNCQQWGWNKCNSDKQKSYTKGNWENVLQTNNVMSDGHYEMPERMRSTFIWNVVGKQNLGSTLAPNKFQLHEITVLGGSGQHYA